MELLKKFYFTYGTHGYPFSGGWTVVFAEDLKQAIGVFRLVHPDKAEGFLNCADYYSEEEFTQTEMYEEGNFGASLHETLMLTKFVSDIGRSKL